MNESAWQLRSRDLDRVQLKKDEPGHRLFLDIENNPIFRLMLFQERRKRPTHVKEATSRVAKAQIGLGCVIFLLLIAMGIGYFVFDIAGFWILIGFLVLIHLGLAGFYLDTKFKDPDRKKRTITSFAFGNLPNAMMDDLLLAGIDARTMVRGHWATQRIASRGMLIAFFCLDIILALVAAFIGMKGGFYFFGAMAILTLLYLGTAALRFNARHGILDTYDAAKSFYERTTNMAVDLPFDAQVEESLPFAGIPEVILIIFAIPIAALSLILSSLDAETHLRVLFHFLAPVFCFFYSQLIALYANRGKQRRIPQYYRYSIYLVRDGLTNVNEVDRIS